MNVMEFANENVDRKAKLGSRICRVVGYSSLKTQINEVLVELEKQPGGYNGWPRGNDKNIILLVDDSDITHLYWAGVSSLLFIEEKKPAPSVNLYSKSCKYCGFPARINKSFMLCSKLCPRSKKQYLIPLLKIIKPQPSSTQQFIVCSRCDERAVYIRRFYSNECQQDYLNFNKLPIGSKRLARLVRCLNNHYWLHVLKINDKINKRSIIKSWNGLEWVTDSKIV